MNRHALLGLLAIGVASCTSGTDAVRTRFAREFDCNADLDVRELGGAMGRQAYRVLGCGHDTTYYCGATGPGMEYSCIRDSADAVAVTSGGSAEAPTPVALRPDELHVAVARAMRPVRDALHACLGRAIPPMRLQLLPDGSVRGSVPIAARSPSEACAQRVLAGVRLAAPPPTERTIDWRLSIDLPMALADDDLVQIRTGLASRVDAVRTCFGDRPLVRVGVYTLAAGTVSSVQLPRATPSAVTTCVRTAVVGADVGPLTADRSLNWDLTGSVDVAPTPPPVPPTPPVAETASAPIDAITVATRAHGAEIVACVGRSPVGLHAAWDAHGSVTLSVQGARAGGPEERCVRRVVGALAVQAATAGDDIVVVTSP